MKSYTDIEKIKAGRIEGGRDKVKKIPLSQELQKPPLSHLYLNTSFMKSLLFFLLVYSTAFAQPCTKSDDLLNIPGSLKDHTKFPIGGGTFTALEKPVALKTLIRAENLCKKGFTLKGGEASCWFHLEDGGYFDVNPVTVYRLKIGFYRHICVNGKKVNSDEYGVDFNIIINPELDDHYPFAVPPSANEFYQDRAKLGYLPISIFRYLSMTAAMGESINNGKGYTGYTTGNNYNEHKDEYRNWYITKPGTPILIPVTRKEFLESLLECYEREKRFVTNRMKIKLDESIRYMAQYQKSGNKAMYQSHLENKQQAEKAMSELDGILLNKKQVVQDLLKKDTKWLQQPAMIDPGKRIAFDERKPQESMVFTGFFSGPAAHTLYRYNPALAAALKSQPAKPLFFQVQYRFKSEELFSKQITEGFVKGFDFEALRKLL